MLYGSAKGLVVWYYLRRDAEVALHAQSNSQRAALSPVAQTARVPATAVAWAVLILHPATRTASGSTARHCPT
jgi:hypothetical protein